MVGGAAKGQKPALSSPREAPKPPLTSPSPLLPETNRNVRKGIIPGKTKIVMVESPTNPRMQICDVKAICDLARAAGAITCVDNSIMAPVRERSPLGGDTLPLLLHPPPLPPPSSSCSSFSSPNG